jgi:hypothetical protein
MKLLTYLLPILLFSCGRGSTGKNAAVMETELDIQEILLGQSLSCAPISGTSCPEGVGKIIVQSENNPEEFILCTGFLIGPDRVVTNGHCLSEVQDCSRAYVTFPHLGGSLSAKCSSINKTFYNEGDFSRSRDITVFAIDQKLPLRTLNIATQRAQQGDTYSIWSMDHINILESRLTEFECRYEGEGLTEEYSRCPVIQGNSGSPVVDGQDNAVSIIWGSSLDRSVGANIDLAQRRELEATAFAYSLQILRSLSLE